MTASVLLLVMICGSSVSAVLISLDAVKRSDQQWCSSLLLLTSNPVRPPADPAQNKSQEQEWELYEDFLRLERQYHC